jgi:peptidoglycan/LPS O-acetylase OafA/YrhL
MYDIVATLAIMWLLFPFHLPVLQCKTNGELYTLLVRSFYLQFLWGVVTMAGGTALNVQAVAPFAIATMHPIGRYPIFVMGMCAGLLTLRSSTPTDSDVDSPLISENVKQDELNPLDMWPKSFLYFFPWYNKTPETVEESNIGCFETAEDRSNFWMNRTYALSGFILSFTILMAIVDTIVRIALDFEMGILSGLWLQLIAPFVQLEIVVGLVLENKSASRVRRVLTHRVALFLGKLSMTIYLIHWVLIYYMCLILNDWEIVHWPYNTLEKITHDQCEDDYVEGALQEACKDDVDEFYRIRSIPMWTIPIIITGSILFSCPLFYWLEEPARSMLRAKNKKQPLSVAKS